MTLPSTGAKHKPVLDENSFQQLLAAAYIVQQHNDGSRGQDSRFDTQKVLLEIAEIQSRMRTEGLDVAAACRLIADRLRTRTGATGLSVSIITDGYLDCVAESGAPAKLPGSSVASHSLVATERLKSGEIFESSDAQTDIRLDPDLCRESGVGSMIAVPIQAYGEVAGVIEVRWNRTNAFREGDVRACQLMASLATGMLERKSRAKQRDGSGWGLPLKDSAPAQAATPPAVSMAALGRTPQAEILPEQSYESDAAVPLFAERSESLPAECGVCGRPFGPDEVFCGHCSRPRTAGPSDERLQSKWASLWYMRQAQESQASVPDSAALPPVTARATEEPATSIAGPISPATPAELPAPIFSSPDQVSPERTAWNTTWNPESEIRPEPLQLTAAAANATVPSPTKDARWWRRTLLTVRLPMRPRNVVLIVGGAVLLLVIAAAWPAPKNGQLTWFESLLVEMGLAQAPAQSPIYSGKPEVRVWEDIHTALYYCEGSDMYGKTPGGRFATQRDAEQDQFESATRTACP